MVRLTTARQLRGSYELSAMYASDYGMTTLYDRANVTDATHGTIDYNGIGRGRRSSRRWKYCNKCTYQKCVDIMSQVWKSYSKYHGKS
jgi:hypothetical protein